MKHIYLFLSVIILSFTMTGCLEDPDMDMKLRNANPPEVSGLEKVQATASTLELKAFVAKENGLPVAECGFCWGDSEDTDPMDHLEENRFVRAEVAENKEFTAEISNLDDNKEYVVYAYATNLKGTAFSAFGKYRTIEGVGEVKTLEPDSIHATAVLLAGKLINRGEGEITDLGFYLSSKEGNIAPSQSDNDTIIRYDFTDKDINLIDTFVCRGTGLKPDTKYYFRAFATNSFGEFSYNTDSFITTTGKPSIESISLVHTSYTSVDVAAIISDPGDDEVTTYGFCWSMTNAIKPEIGQTGTDTIECSGLSEGKFIGTIDKLETAKTYYARAYAINKFGTAYSDDVLNIFTLDKAPNILTSVIDKSLIQKGSAVVGGKLQNGGESDVIEWGIYWSSDKKKLDRQEIAEDSIFTCTLSNLKGGTDYYVCAYAKNLNGYIGYGDTLTFRTPDVFTQKTVYSESRAFSATFTVDNKIFVVGGDIGNKCTNDLISYVPENDEWVSLAPYKNAYCNVSACVDKRGDIYTAGGTDKQKKVTDFAKYDYSSNVWDNTLVPIPEAVANAVMFGHKDSIYVIGGKDDRGNNTENIFIFDVNSGNWKKSTVKFPVAQQNGLAVVVGDTVFAGLGEATKKGLWYAVDTLTEWYKVENIPGNIGVVLSGVYHQQKNSIFMIDDNGKIWEYGIKSKKWSSRSAFPHLMKNYHLCILDDTIYILGQYMYGANYFMTYDPDWDN